MKHAVTRLGDALVVSLRGNPSTAYFWEVEAVDETILKQVGESEFKPDHQAIGSAGVVTLSFEAVATGETALRLIYHYHLTTFDDGGPPVDTSEVMVKVNEPVPQDE